jgi:hypothetical protein
LAALNKHTFWCGDEFLMKMKNSSGGFGNFSGEHSKKKGYYTV